MAIAVCKSLVSEDVRTHVGDSVAFLAALARERPADLLSVDLLYLDSGLGHVRAPTKRHTSSQGASRDCALALRVYARNGGRFATNGGRICKRNAVQGLIAPQDRWQGNAHR